MWALHTLRDSYGNMTVLHFRYQAGLFYKKI